MTEKLLTTKQAGDYLGIDSKSLANSRSTGTGACIPYIKIGRLVRYKLSDLISFIEGNTHTHTGQAQGGSSE